MKTVRVGKDDEFDLFTAVIAEKCVHVYKNVSLECIIRAPEYVKDISLTEAKSNPDSHSDSNPGWQLYVLSNSGIIYRVLRDQALTERQQDAEAVPGSDNHEIFSDLLDNGLVSDPFDLQLTSEDVYFVNQHHAVLKVKEETVSISVACGFVAVVSENVRYFMIYLYLEEVLQSLQTAVQPVSTFYSQRTRVGHKNLNGKLKYSIFFVVSNLHNSDSDNSCALLNLPSSFFQALFGSESTLINSPVMLICPPDGSVFYTPVKSLQILEYPDKSLRNFKIFCHTNYPVVRIKATSLKLKHQHKNNEPQSLQISSSSEEDFRWQPSLILCTHDGFSLAVTTNSRKHIVFLTFLVPGPVEDFDVYGSQVYHSTGLDVSETEVEVFAEDTLPILNVSKSRNLSYRDVQKLICLPRHGEINSTKCNLLVKIPDIRLKAIKPSNKSRFMSSRASSNVAGQRIGDLLHCLDNCSIRSDDVKLLQRKQASFLSQLTIASNLISSFSQKENLQNLFTFKFEVQKSQNIELSFESDWLLVCHVTNQSTVTLSSDWMLMVSVRQKTTAGFDKYQITYTFNLSDGLKAKSTVRFEVSPWKHNFSLLTPLEIETTLLLHLPEFASSGFLDQMQRETKPCDIRTLPILLNASSIDILHSLVSADVTRLASTDIGCDQNFEDVITLLAKTKPISECVNTLTGTAGKSSADFGEMKVFLPATVRNSTTVLKYGKGNVAVLRYILEHSLQPEKLTSSHITMLTLAGDKVHLGVEDQTSDRNGECVEKDLVIVIHTTDRCTAVAVHQAVVSKFKELGTIGGVNNISLMRMSSELTKLEGYLKEIRTLQDKPESLANILESGKKLLKLHEKVRNLVSFYKC